MALEDDATISAVTLSDEVPAVAPATTDDPAKVDDESKVPADAQEGPAKVEDEPEKPKSKRADKYREMQSRAESAEMRALSEARRADELLKLNEKLKHAASTTDDFDEKQRAEMRLALNENELERLNDNFKGARTEHGAATMELFQERVAEAVERLPDIMSVFASEAAQRTPVSTHAAVVLAHNEHGPDILYHLVKNPLEARRIFALPPALQGVELTRLEHKLISRPATKKVSTAPSPVPTVGGSKASTAKDPATMTFKEYEAWRSSSRK